MALNRGFHEKYNLCSVIHVSYKVLTEIVLVYVWVPGRKQYGLRGMRDLWVICALPLHTKSVTKKFYGIRGSMGFQGYGLGGLRLYLGRLRQGGRG